MELFYSPDMGGGFGHLGPEESVHCVKVLRHRTGDRIHVIDGEGTLYLCELVSDSPKGVDLMVLSSEPGWGSHPYHLTLAVCPTKNNDRYEWFAEKATELGVDRIVPVIGDRSERKVYKTGRAERIALAATKQSLKARIPDIAEPVSVRAFIRGCEARTRLIACCFEEDQPRTGIREALRGASDIAVLIGPEGDFSPEELRLAQAAGFVPIHLGPSRLRTETAALTAVEAVYLEHIDFV
jgi:16S rRNA (uracil1498-N3)-methyltransferase